MIPPEWLIGLASTAFGLTGFWLAFGGFIVALVFLTMYRAPISDFIRRTRKIGAGRFGAEAQDQTPEQKAPPPITETLTQHPDTKGDPRHAADELISKLPRTSYVIGQEDILRKALSERGLEPGSPDTYRALIAFTSSAFVMGIFEQLYNVLWTTQLHVLHAANPRAPHGLAEEEIRTFYNLGAAATPAVYAQYPFEAYLGFLTNQQLLVTAGGPILDYGKGSSVTCLSRPRGEGSSWSNLLSDQGDSLAHLGR